ncbi:MAG: DinB family protein [Polyangiaceae bacterium]
MQVELARAHARYNHWMNEKLYAAASELTDEQRTRDVGAFFKSLHLTLHHLLVADRIWLTRFDVPGVAVAGDVATSFDALRKARRVEDARILSYVTSLDEAALIAPLSYRNLRGEPFTHPQWLALFHLFNHQTHHRGQATTLLMQLGKDPGVTDLIAFLRMP